MRKTKQNQSGSYRSQQRGKINRETDGVHTTCVEGVAVDDAFKKRCSVVGEHVRKTNSLLEKNVVEGEVETHGSAKTENVN